MRYFLSLGSNIGDRRGNIARAVAALGKAEVKLLRSSSLYRTQPVGFAAQPWYYNQVVEVSADMDPSGLLALIKIVERELGRQPARRNRPRPIDIDILMAEDRLVKTRELTVPHPRMAERNFVLVPLLEIAPATVHPVLRKTVSDLLKESRDESRVMPVAKRAGRSDHKRSQHP